MGDTENIPETFHKNNPKSRYPRKTVCPSCKQETTFVCIGEQRWPEDLALSAEMDAVVTVWRCSNCQTTMSAPVLEGLMK
jgi:hypothetical protein